MSASITVMQAGHVAAVCTPTHVHLCPALQAAPTEHPDRLHAQAKSLVAGAILRGEVAGPYDDVDAEAAAVLLLEDRAFKMHYRAHEL